MVRLSIDDLLLISEAAMRDGGSVAAENGYGEASAIGEQIDVPALTRIIEMLDLVASEDPIENAARLAARLAWERPLGIASERTALLAVAVILDLSGILPPRDWAGCAALIKGQRRSGLGLGARTEQIQKWLESGVASAPT